MQYSLVQRLFSTRKSNTHLNSFYTRKQILPEAKQTTPFKHNLENFEMKTADYSDYPQCTLIAVRRKRPTCPIWRACRKYPRIIAN